ncbi:MAG: class I SAM-dependent rRNA methyltransferase [Planctomycetota bacterium]
MGRITLTGRGRRRVLGGHPWIYKDDIAAGEGDRGELLPVEAPDGSTLGWGLFSTASKIAVRLVTREKEQPKREFWLGRVRRAVEARRALGLDEERGACRLIGGDADGLPGFVVDRYADTLVVQSGCQGSDRMRDFLLTLCDEVRGVEAARVYDRSDARVRKLEDLEPRAEWVRGAASGPIEVEEPTPGGPALRFEVDVVEGHKTGHYLDQRDNRVRAAAYAACKDGARVLDAFSYDGLFGIRAALAGARDVLCLDQSGPAGERVLRNAERNGVADRVRFEKVNAMHDLKRRATEGERYELVIVDPPAFARNRREAEGAGRGYRELNLRALGLLRDGGYLVTCSCSFNVKPADFAGFVADASRDAGVPAWLVETAGAAPDHPALVTLPESSYLKCLVLRT